jgi:multidrug efflux pump
MGVVIASGLAIGTLFTLFVVPAVYLVFAADHHTSAAGATAASEPQPAAGA